MLPSLLSTSTGRRDNPVGMLGILLLLVIALMAVGTFTRRAAGGPDPPIIAGLLAGLIIAVLVMATFAVVDNPLMARGPGPVRSGRRRVSPGACSRTACRSSSAATPLPAVMTINPGQAPATWFQTDPNSFTGYPERIAWNRPG